MTYVLKDLENQLNLRADTLKRALTKSVSVIHSTGNYVYLESEIKKLNRRYSSYSEISQDLYDFLISQYNSTDDFIDASKIQKDNRLNLKYYQEFLRKTKFFSSGIADFLGFNIFLHSNHTYILKRKVKAFLRRFFVWNLGNHSKKSGYILDVETGFNSEFYSLEEVYINSSKRGRILGFTKAENGKLEAIVGFYSNEILLCNKLSRTTNSIDFYDLDEDKTPIFFNFQFEDILNKNNRQILNILINNLDKTEVEFTWSGSKLLIQATTKPIDLKTYRKSEKTTKAKIKKIEQSFGKFSAKKLKNELDQWLLKPAYSYIKGDKIFFNSTVKKVSFFVDNKSFEKLNKLGISSGLNSSIIIEQMLSIYSNSAFLSEDEFLNSLNEQFLRWSEDFDERLLDWQKLLKTKNSEETLEEIDKILHGRIK